MDTLMLLLTMHIAVAVVLSGSMMGVLTAGIQKRTSKLYDSMMASFVMVIVSGVGLLVVNPASLGRFCAMMTAFTLLTFVVRAYYRNRISLTKSL